MNHASDKDIIKKDRGLSKTMYTSFYEREDWDDGSFVISQYNHGTFDKTLRFGPLTTRLSQLLACGFVLTIESSIHRRKHDLILRNKNETYKLAVIANCDVNCHEDITMFIRDQSEPEHKVEKQVMIDPLDQLLVKYPIKRKCIEFIGNYTLKEYVKQQLKQTRKLNHGE